MTSTLFSNQHTYIKKIYNIYIYIYILYQIYGCVFYGSPSWHLEGAMVQSLCVDWRKALRCVYSVNNRTHCDIITSLSNQFPLILSLKERFIKFIRNCLFCQNNTVKFFPHVAICTLMSNTCRNYRDRGILDSDDNWSIKYNMNEWHLISDNICTEIDVLLDLINVREGNKSVMVLLEKKSTSWYMIFVLTEIVF